ncbi:MAG: amidase, partial [Gammaproteobacteria bacterium]
MRLGRIDRREALAGIAAVVASARFGSALAQSEATEGDPTELTLLEASRRIRAGALSPVELTRAYLAAIERLEPRINAFITITGDLALERARALEAELEAGRWRGPLHGVPIALKDNIDTAGIRTTAAGAVFAERVPDADAEVWRRLEAAGAILLGKLNMHEYAYGGTSSIT